MPYCTPAPKAPIPLLPHRYYHTTSGNGVAPPPLSPDPPPKVPSLTSNPAVYHGRHTLPPWGVPKFMLPLKRAQKTIFSSHFDPGLGISARAVLKGGKNLRNANRNEPSRGRSLLNVHGTFSTSKVGGWWLASVGGWRLVVPGGCP